MELFGYRFQTEYIICALAGLILILLIMDIIQFIKLSRLKNRLSAFTEGADGRSMETEITEKFAEIKALKENQEKTGSDVRRILNELRLTYRKSALTKYDALREMGGKLSFVLVLLDKNNDGVLLNSVHSTTSGNYMYIKEIEKGKSELELSTEEAETLHRAISEGR